MFRQNLVNHAQGRTMKSAGSNFSGRPAGDVAVSTVQTLRQQIRHLETAGRRDGGHRISTGSATLDAGLPDGGLVAGTIAEWLTVSRGHGALILSLLAARSACAGGGALVVIDGDHSFHPPAAVAWGIHPDNVVVLRPPSGERTALFWAIDQSLRCPAVAAVWGSLGRIDPRWQRRFQLSAESSGALGLFVRPLSVREDPGWSDVQWQVGPDRQPPAAPRPPGPFPGDSFARRMVVRLLRVRGGAAWVCPPWNLQIDFTTGVIERVDHDREHQRVVESTGAVRGARPSPCAGHLAAGLARPAADCRQQRA